MQQKFAEEVKEIALKVMVQDWRVRIEQIETLFAFIDENVNVFQSSQKQSRMSDVTDIICKLLGDQNVKI